VTRKASGGSDEGQASGETRPGWRGGAGGAAVSDRRLRLSRWSRVLYALLVIGATVILLHGRPPLTDKSLSWVETILLLPGLISYLPLMLLSGGIHWSVLPLRSQVPLWGILNVCGYLGIPPTIRAMRMWWRDRGAYPGYQKRLQGIFFKPIMMIVLGLGMLLVALNGALQIRRGIDGPTDIANTVLGSIGAIGLWTLAYLERRYKALSRVAGKGPPAWTRWAVSIAAITGAVIGALLTYGEMRILRWSKASAGVLAVTLAALTLAMAWIIFRLVRKQR